MKARMAAAVLAASALTVSTLPASANTTDEPDFTIMDRVEASDDVVVMDLDHGDSMIIDVMDNDMVLEVGADTAEIIIDDQPWGGHIVRVIPPANSMETAKIEFTVNRRDVTQFVGTQFTYHLEIPTGKVSQSATVLVKEAALNR